MLARIDLYLLPKSTALWYFTRLGWLALTALFAIYLPPTPRPFFCSIYSNPPFTTPSLLTTTLREGKPCTCLGRHFYHFACWMNVFPCYQWNLYQPDRFTDLNVVIDWLDGLALVGWAAFTGFNTLASGRILSGSSSSTIALLLSLFTFTYVHATCSTRLYLPLYPHGYNHLSFFWQEWYNKQDQSHFIANLLVIARRSLIDSLIYRMKKRLVSRAGYYLSYKHQMDGWWINLTLNLLLPET